MYSAFRFDARVLEAHISGRKHHSIIEAITGLFRS